MIDIFGRKVFWVGFGRLLIIFGRFFGYGSK